MRQFLLPGQVNNDSSITVEGREYHYLRHVLRLKKGDSFQGIDRRGNIYNVKLSDVSKQTMTLKIISGRSTRVDDCHIVLLQCLLKGRKMETVIRMAAEMGVKRIVPVVSDYTVVHNVKKAAGKNKLQRWRTIAEQAVQQSGSSIVPEMTEPILLDNGLASWSTDGLCVFCHQEAVGSTSLHELLAADPDSVTLLIGPEGGFSDRELPLLLRQGFIPVYLGENILRAETAAIYTLAAFKIILLEKKVWRLQPEQEKR
jgi:16S rRNA (uracil1498-N3)-methyltransferase